VSGLVVVGVDGTTAAHRALVFALAEAHLRGTSLDAVTVWRQPYAQTIAVDGTLLPDPGCEAADRLEASLARVHADDWGVPVQRRVLYGQPAEMLARAALGAHLLVVGSRGRSPLTGVLLGSVAQQLLRDAPCPVTVVPSNTDRRRHGRWLRSLSGL
jgi:nucleotide-binding universal stress UspA family protein